MEFNLNFYPETIKDLEKLGIKNHYKSSPLMIQKINLIRDGIIKNLVDIRIKPVDHKFFIITHGEHVEFVKDRNEAVWTLGSRYGNRVLSLSKKFEAIVWYKNSVTIDPKKIKLVENRIDEIRSERGLRA